MNSQAAVALRSPDEVASHIARCDARFAPIIALAGVPPLAHRASNVNDRFPSLVRAITHQLLATSAATTIHQRIVETCGGAVDVHSIIAAGPAQLREAGVNNNKARAMVDLAHHVRDGRLRLERHGRMSDDEVIREMSAVRGIGTWTAQMYLMNTLARRDVWPTGDYGVRVGWSLVHGLDDTISARELEGCGTPFAGVRSSVAWYCWRATHAATLSSRRLAQ